MRKKLLFIIPSFRTGGVERVTLNILNSLDFMNYDVSLIIIESRDNVLLDNLNKSVSVIELGKSSLRSGVTDIYSIIKRFKPDVVFTSFNHISVLVYFLQVFARCKFKMVVRLNSLPSNKLESNWRDKVYNIVYKKVVRNAARVVSQSNEMTKEIICYYSLKKDKVSTIRNPVDSMLIRKKASEFIDKKFDTAFYNMVAIGSLSEVKGFDLLIKAVHQSVKRGNNNIRLYIIGGNRESNNDYHSILSKLVEELNLGDRVFLLGYSNNPYVYLKQCDAFVLSSRKEGFPNVVLEALVLNKPCLVTSCVDLSNVIYGERGIIVEKESVEALSKGIDLIKDIRGEALEFENFDFNYFFSKI